MPDTHTQPIHAFIAGTHRTSSGATVTISAEDLQAAAAAYNPELHEAPLVIGHPTGQAPAYGWVESFRVEGNDLLAMPTQVNPDFSELHKTGAFKKRSMSFYHPDNPNNPVAGVWYPRHLGFLGAVAPAIKGLRAADFADEGEMLTVDFGSHEDQTEAGLWRSLREWMIGKFGKDEADKTIPDWDVQSLQREADKEQQQEQSEEAKLAPPQPAFAEDEKEGAMPDNDEQAQQLLARENKLKQREEVLAAREAAMHRADCATFAESLLTQGKLLPAMKDGVVDFMAALERVETIAFAEGESTSHKTPLDFMKDYLQAQPPLVSFGELPNDDGKGVDVTDAKALAAAAVDFQESEAAKGRNITITEAVKHIEAQGSNA